MLIVTPMIADGYLTTDLFCSNINKTLPQYPKVTTCVQSLTGLSAMPLDLGSDVKEGVLYEKRSRLVD